MYTSRIKQYTIHSSALSGNRDNKNMLKAKTGTKIHGVLGFRHPL
jgi:hypothetical protein